jgi:hypothetical protein
MPRRDPGVFLLRPRHGAAITSSSHRRHAACGLQLRSLRFSGETAAFGAVGKYRRLCDSSAARPLAATDLQGSNSPEIA